MPISRRDFVLRAGQVGGALYVSGSPLADRFLGLIHDSFGRAPADVDALRSRTEALCAKRPLYPGFRGYTTYVA